MSVPFIVRRAPVPSPVDTGNTAKDGGGAGARLSVSRETPAGLGTLSVPLTVGMARCPPSRHGESSEGRRRPGFAGFSVSPETPGVGEERTAASYQHPGLRQLT